MLFESFKLIGVYVDMGSIFVLLIIAYLINKFLMFKLFFYTFLSFILTEVITLFGLIIVF